MSAAGGSHARRSSAGSTGLQIHRSNAISLLMSQNDLSTALSTPIERTLLASQVGSRAKATRLIIKQKMGRDELKSDTLG
jgi:hypothetical protein